MKSEIRTFRHEDGEIQRVQIVRPGDWESLSFLRPEPSERAFEQFCYIYENFIVAAFPWIFGRLVLFRLPEGMEVPGGSADREFGEISDPYIAASVLLRRGVRIGKEGPVFRDERTRRFWKALEERNCLRVVRGKRSNTKIIAVPDRCGFLSESATEARMKCNTSFFIMDFIDTATPYDLLGTPVGLCVKDGEILLPAMYGREALLVTDRGVSVRKMNIRDMKIRIGDWEVPGEALYCRPDRKTTPRWNGDDLVVVGRQVVAVHHGGGTAIPSSGFVVRSPEGGRFSPGDPVFYAGMEDVKFGIQAGNSAVVDGKLTEKFISPFYDFRKFWKEYSYPPGMYPLKYDRDRAARMAIGADSAGKPVIVWAEGAGKFGYRKGEESCGATLMEMAEICREAGMENGVNLDGGGSAQILIGGRRSLLISDRDRETNRDLERAVPLGLAVL